jgi:hypothetical protein
LQAQIAQQLVTQTDPLRKMLIDRSTDFLGGNLDVANTPMFSALKQQTESQYGNARNNIIADTPVGGPLIRALTDLNARRADTLGQGAGAVAESELGRAMGLATGSTAQGMSGLGQAAQTQAALAQNSAMREAGLFSALGTGVGAWLGGK